MSIDLAIKHARTNPILPRGRNSISRFGCVITDGFRFFKGHNSYRTHPWQAKYGARTGLPEAVHVHSEIAALVQATRSGIVPSRSTVFVARVLKDGSPALAKPCPGCLMALTEFGFTDIHWTE